MVWTLFRQQQQCGAQLHARPKRPRQPGEGDTRQPQAQQGETELDQDERGEDAEQTVDAQAEQALSELDGGERDEEGRLDRND